VTENYTCKLEVPTVPVVNLLTMKLQP